MDGDQLIAKLNAMGWQATESDVLVMSTGDLTLHAIRMVTLHEGHVVIVTEASKY